MISLDKLDYFRVLVRTGSFEHAARKLHITQSSLSRSIQSLERDLGVTLIERQRGRQGIRLTSAGQELLRRVDPLLEDASELERAISEVSSAPQRELSFGIGPMMASTSLTEPLLGLMKAFPGMEVSVVIGEGQAMTQQLINGVIEFYIGPFHSRAQHAGVKRRRFGSRPAGILVRPGHPLVDESRVTAEMIGRFPRVSGTAWNDRLNYVDDDIARHLRATIEIDNFELLVRLTRQSDAVLMFSARDAEQLLVPLVTDFAITDSPEISAFYLADHQLSAAADLAVEWLRAAYVHRLGQPDAL